MIKVKEKWQPDSKQADEWSRILDQNVSHHSSKKVRLAEVLAMCTGYTEDLVEKKSTSNIRSAGHVM